MENRQISLEQLSDIYGFRVVVDDLDACYRALGVVHSAWRAVPGRFKDYISTPKQNNYQSIHTTIVGPRHQRVELQIRTERHAPASPNTAWPRTPSTRTASHAQTGTRRQRQRGWRSKENPYIWLRRLVDTLLEGDNPEEFLEHTKLELFQDQVFCFTPKGRLIALPRGATPIDFAYAVHTDIGNSCVGAVINGRQLPLTTQLQERRRGRDPDRQGPDAARRLGAHRRHRQGAVRHPPRAPATRCARQYSELGRRLLVSAFRSDRPGLFRRQAQEGPGAADAEIGRRGARRRRPRRAAGSRCDPCHRAGSRARPSSRRRSAQAQPSPARPGRGGLVQPRQGDRPQVPLAGQRRRRRSQASAGAADPRPARTTCRSRSRKAAPCPATASSACCPTARASASSRSIRPSSRSTSTSAGST